MTALYLYDDARARLFEPFALTRPASELRAGVALIRERWERALALPAAGAIVAPHLARFEERGAPPAAAGLVPAGAVIANARCVVSLAPARRDTDVWTCAGRVAAVRLAGAVDVAELAGGDVSLDSLSAAGTRVADVGGRWADEVWSLVAQLLPQLHEDIAAIGPTLSCAPPADAIVIGDAPLYIERGAVIEPHVCFDVTAGPVLVRAGTNVRAFTRLVGPAAVAGGSTILGDRVHGCSIGEACVVRGEVSETIVLGHSNKAHDGFVGHSILGRWVNLGAGTITSNLKNTYGAVALWTPSGVRNTGLLKLGTLFGDHVKTGIGLRLTTGTVIGAAANVYGSAMPPKYVPPFSWGEGSALVPYRLDKFFETAERAMGRRQVSLGAGTREQLGASYARAQEAER